MKYIGILALMGLCLPLIAGAGIFDETQPPLFSGCGSYEVTGEVIWAENVTYLRLFPYGNQETYLRVRDMTDLKALRMVGFTVKATGDIVRPLKGRQGEIIVRAIDAVAPNPAAFHRGHGFRKLKDFACKTAAQIKDPVPVVRPTGSRNDGGF